MESEEQRQSHRYLWMRHWHLRKWSKAFYRWIRIRLNRSTNSHFWGKRILEEARKRWLYLQDLLLWLQNEWLEVGCSGHHQRSNSRIFSNKKFRIIRFGRWCWYKCHFREAARASEEENWVDEQDHTVVKEETGSLEFRKRWLWSERHGWSKCLFAIVWRHRDIVLLQFLNTIFRPDSANKPPRMDNQRSDDEQRIGI